MVKENSFRGRLSAGWTQEELMRHYALTVMEYDQVIACLGKLCGEQA